MAKNGVNLMYYYEINKLKKNMKKKQKCHISYITSYDAI